MNVGIIVMMVLMLFVITAIIFKPIFYLVNRYYFNIPKELLFLGEDKAYIEFVKKLYKENSKLSNKRLHLLESLRTFKDLLSNEDLLLLKVYVNCKVEEYKNFRGISFISTFFTSIIALIVSTISLAKLDIELGKYFLLVIVIGIGYISFVFTIGVVQHVRRKNQFNLLKNMIELCIEERDQKRSMMRTRTRHRRRS